MTHYIAVLALIGLVGLVLTRVIILRRKGIQAAHFGKLDKTDFLLPPFVLFYFYLIFAAAFNLPSVSTQEFFQSDIISWVGVGCCVLSLSLFAWSLVSFGQSFRIGIDVEQPDKLVTTGVFAFSRNPIYVAFALTLIGQFLIFPNWILLLYWVAAMWMIHRQVLREEDFLRSHYGEEFVEYSNQVRRYV